MTSLIVREEYAFVNGAPPVAPVILKLELSSVNLSIRVSSSTIEQSAEWPDEN